MKKVKIKLPHHQDFNMRMMFSRGMSKQVCAVKPFVLNDYVRRFISESENGLRPKAIERDSQIKDYLSVMKDPAANPYVYVVGSEPSDKRAKYLASSIACRYLEMYPTASKGLVCHTLTGSYKDYYRDHSDNKVGKPKLMILSNITAESTEVKIEKLRDLLELYSDIPRIVCITGVNPLTFCNDYIRYHCNYMTWIYSTRKASTLGIS